MKKLYARVLGLLLAGICAFSLTAPSLADEAGSAADTRQPASAESAAVSEKNAPSQGEAGQSGALAEDSPEETVPEEETASEEEDPADDPLQNLGTELVLEEDGLAVLQDEDWKNIHPDKDVWTLPAQTDEIRLQFQLPVQEESAWDWEKPLWVQLPSLDEGYEYQNEDGDLLSGPEQQAGTYEYLNPPEASSDSTWLRLHPDDALAFGTGDDSRIEVFLKRTSDQAIDLSLATDTQSLRIEQPEKPAPEKTEVEAREAAKPIAEAEISESEEPAAGTSGQSGTIAEEAEPEGQADQPAEDDTETAANPNPEEYTEDEFAVFSAVNLNHFLKNAGLSIEYSGPYWIHYEPVQKVNGVWVIPSDAHYLRIALGYTLPPHTLTADNNQVVYQFPSQIHPDEASGDIFNDYGSIIGTYHVYPDGRMVLTYNKDIVESNAAGQEITGHIVAQGVFDRSHITDDKNTSIPLGPGVSVTVTMKKDIAISITKSADVSNNTTTSRTIPYVITVHSKGGTADPVDISDTWNTPLIGADNIQVYGPDGQITNFQLEKSDKGFEITGLPPLLNGQDYKVKYDGIVDENQVVSAQLGNTATVHSKDIYHSDLTAQASKWVHYTGSLSLKKEGRVESDNKVHWTITVNKNGLNIGGWNLQDVLDGIPFNGEVTITPQGGQPLVTTLPYTFPAGFDKPCTITYTTPAEPQIGRDQISNQASLGKGQQAVNTTNSIQRPAFHPLKKTGTGTDMSDDGNTLSLGWHIRVSADPYTIQGPWTLTEWLWGNDGQRFTAAQVQQLEEDVLNAARKAGIRNVTFHVYRKQYDRQAVDKLQSDETYEKITMTFAQPLEKGKTIEVDLETEAPASALKNHDSVAFFNNASINGTDAQRASNTWKNQPEPGKGKFSIQKFDNSAGSTSGRNTVHEEDDLDENTVKWAVPVTIPPDWDGGPITVTDTIPAGLRFRPYWTKLWINNQETTVQVQGEQGTGWWNGQKIPITLDKNAGANGTLTMTLSQAVINEMKQSVVGNSISVKLRLSFEIDNHKDWLTSHQDGTKYYMYTNHARLSDQDGNSLGSATQSQTIRMPILRKSCAKPVDDCMPGNVIPYTITFNPAGCKLNDGNPIMLVDTLSYYSSASYITGVSLVPDSLEVLGPDGKPLPSSEWHYTYRVSDSYGTITNTLRITVNDGIPVTIHYSNLVHCPNDDQWPSITNKVTALADHTLDTSQVVSHFHFSTAQITGNVNGITVIKQDAFNAAKRLPDAHFKLQIYKDGQWTDFAKDVYTGSTGQFTMSDIPVQTLCRLIETKAPAGYILPEDEDAYYYFYIIRSGESANVPSEYSGRTHIFIDGDVAYINNTPIETSISVYKRWQNRAGQSVKAGADQASFNIFQIDARGNRTQYNDEPYVLKGPDWMMRITGLPKYEPDDPKKEYTYEVEETGVPDGWESSVTKRDGTNGSETDFYITNTQNIAVQLPDTGSSDLLWLLGAALGLGLLSLHFFAKSKRKELHK